MASRSLGERLLRPSIFRSTYTPSIPRASPAWITQRYISDTPGRPAQPQTQAKAPSQEKGPSRQSNRDEKTSRAIDSLFVGLPRASSNTAANTNRVFGSEFSKAGARGRRPAGLNFDSMSLPNSILNPSSVNRPDEKALLQQQQEDTFSNYPRLNPTYGKQVELNPSRGRDLVRGIGMLGSLVGRNRVRNLQHKQKFHERPGLKRKRLVSERWRKRFKKGFHQMTARVSELTKKGW